MGPDRLLVHILEEWLNDIKRNQIPYVLGGVGPVSSLVQIVRGIKVSLIVPLALVIVIVVASLLLPMIVSRHWSLVLCRSHCPAPRNLDLIPIDLLSI